MRLIWLKAWEHIISVKKVKIVGATALLSTDRKLKIITKQLSFNFKTWKILCLGFLSRSRLTVSRPIQIGKTDNKKWLMRYTDVARMPLLSIRRDVANKEYIQWMDTHNEPATRSGYWKPGKQQNAWPQCKESFGLDLNFKAEHVVDKRFRLGDECRSVSWWIDEIADDDRVIRRYRSGDGCNRHSDSKTCEKRILTSAWQPLKCPWAVSGTCPNWLSFQRGHGTGLPAAHIPLCQSRR